MPVLFAITLFTSALLLFLVQPMVGKMVQPHVGGGPAVWNTCMVFYQALLLGGYWYAHKLTGLADQRKQVTIHLGVLGLAAAVMGLAWTLTPDGSAVPVLKSLAPRGSVFPFFWVVVMMLVAIGVPFFAVSTSAPLLQRWFTATGHPSSRDPYFLYAASNAGSLISLLSYPLFVEPHQKLVEQTWLFGGGFLLLMLLTFACGRASMNPVRPPTAEAKAAAAPPEPELWRKWKWVGLAFVPSSLMLGITTKMTTDVASMPLLWIIPLTLYLLTFILAFGRMPKWTRLVLVNLTPVVTLLLVFVETSGVSLSTGGQAVLHISNFFLLSLLMHGELAHDRPHPKYLTNYFLWISFGGVLGGLFNALVAPLIFPQLYEYPVAIVIGCLLIPAASALEGRADKLAPPADPSPTPPAEPAAEDPRAADLRLMSVVLDFVVPVAMLALVGGLIWAAGWPRFIVVTQWTADALTNLFASCGFPLVVGRDTVYQFAVFAPPCMLCFLFIDRPLRFGLCVLAVLFVHHYQEADQPRVKQTERSFFGIMRIEEGWGADERPEYPVFPSFIHTTTQDGKEVKEPVAKVKAVPDDVTSLSHGTTLHGKQFSKNFHRETFRDQVRLFGATSPLEALVLASGPAVWDATKDPLTYYHRTGPVGDLFREAFRRTRLPRVGMVGLGTGSAAAYAVPGQRMTFYEIDKAVKDMIDSGDDLSPLLLGKLRGRKAAVEEAIRTAAANGNPDNPNLQADLANASAPLEEPALSILRAGGKVDDVMAKLDRAGVRLSPWTRELIASSHRSFTYVTDARKRGADVDIVLGDARLTLSEQSDRKYDLLLIDAFSSDAIPTHLLTVEAVKMYRDRLSANGLLAMHVSNRYLRLEPVVQAIAEELGMSCRLFSDDYDFPTSKYGDAPGKTSSSWMVLARSDAELGPAFLDPPPPAGTFRSPGDGIPVTWKPVLRHPQIPAWTDDYMDVLRVTRFETLQSVRRWFHLANPVPEWDDWMSKQDQQLAERRR